MKIERFPTDKHTLGKVSRILFEIGIADDESIEDMSDMKWLFPTLRFDKSHTLEQKKQAFDDFSKRLKDYIFDSEVPK